MEEETRLASAGSGVYGAGEYTYLTLPPDRALRSCIGLVVAGLAARARIGVAGLEEAVELLEDRHSTKGPTRYRFSLKDDGLVAEVEEWEQAAVRGNDEAGEAGWRTVVEMVS
jgi:putative transcriptional regulator